MSDIIQLLPESIANQIAAGEVIQRPASIVKELVENAIDAGASEIKIIIKDAGRTLVQVIDNGSGMSAADARLAFSRHATSKIKKAEDLFSINTMGFRGEALASIAAVSQTELKTRRASDELGTHLQINGSTVEHQEAISCPVGSNFIIKNLFYNTPARRKFLKKDTTELNHIINEFLRTALSHSNISFSLISNNETKYDLPVSSLKSRIIHVIRKRKNNELVKVETETELVKIHGFIGSPKMAQKSQSEQYFFVNNRYMVHSAFQKTVTEAYAKLIPTDYKPIYFIFFEINPSIIDINIHPQKTEIKFEDEDAIWQILNAAVRESIGRNNLSPAIDFNTADKVDMPVINNDTEIHSPEIPLNPFYNPFDGDLNTNFDFSTDTPSVNFIDETNGNIKNKTISVGSKLNEKTYSSDTLNSDTKNSSSNTVIKQSKGFNNIKIDENWDKLYDDFEQNKNDFENNKEDFFISKNISSEYNEEEEPTQQSLFNENNTNLITTNNSILQYKNKYIFSSVKSGMMIINQRRAHERVLYEQILSQIQTNSYASQQCLYPDIVELSVQDGIIINELLPELKIFGFNIEETEPNTFKVLGKPTFLPDISSQTLFDEIINNYHSSKSNIKEEVKERIARMLVSQSAIQYGKSLTIDEMNNLIGKLFACKEPNFAPNGKPVISIIGNDEIEAKFNF